MIQECESCADLRVQLDTLGIANFTLESLAARAIERAEKAEAENEALKVQLRIASGLVSLEPPE